MDVDDGGSSNGILISGDPRSAHCRVSDAVGDEGRVRVLSGCPTFTFVTFGVWAKLDSQKVRYPYSRCSQKAITKAREIPPASPQNMQSQNTIDPLQNHFILSRMCRARSKSPQGKENASSATLEVIHLHKGGPNVRVGVSFAPDRGDASGEARVTALHPDGHAILSGLLRGDRLVSINGTALQTSLEAARFLRESSGDLWLCVERDLRERGTPTTESESPLRTPRIGKRQSGFGFGVGLIDSCAPWSKIRSLLPISVDSDLPPLSARQNFDPTTLL